MHYWNRARTFSYCGWWNRPGPETEIQLDLARLAQHLPGRILRHDTVDICDQRQCDVTSADSEAPALDPLACESAAQIPNVALAQGAMLLSFPQIGLLIQVGSSACPLS